MSRTCGDGLAKKNHLFRPLEFRRHVNLAHKNRTPTVPDALSALTASRYKLPLKTGDVPPRSNDLSSGSYTIVIVFSFLDSDRSALRRSLRRMALAVASTSVDPAELIELLLE